MDVSADVVRNRVRRRRGAVRKRILRNDCHGPRGEHHGDGPGRGPVPKEGRNDNLRTTATATLAEAFPRAPE